MLSSLAKNILATIVYYDVLDYPLTAFEIGKYLMRAETKNPETEEKFGLANILTELESRELKKMVEEYQGFYFLSGRQELVAQRNARTKISEKKIKSVLNTLRWLRCVPFFEGAAVTGRLAMKNAEVKSDLDLLVIIKKNRLFTGRFLITAMVQLMGRRRHGEKITDRICLNHFLTDECTIALHSLFSANEYAFLLPVWGDFSQFYAQNAWIEEFKPNFFPKLTSTRLIKDTAFAKGIRNFLEKFFDWDFIENILAKWQKEKIKRNPKTSQPGSVIICEKTELAFWPNFANQETKIMENFSLKLETLLSRSRNF